MRALREALPDIVGSRRVRVIFGVMRDKPIVGMLEELRQLTDAPLLVAVPSPRSADPAELANQFGPAAVVATSLEAALHQSFADYPDAVTLVCGSLALVGAAKQIIEGLTRRQN